MLPSRSAMITVGWALLALAALNRIPQTRRLING